MWVGAEITVVVDHATWGILLHACVGRARARLLAGEVVVVRPTVGPAPPRGITVAAPGTAALKCRVGLRHHARTRSATQRPPLFLAHGRRQTGAGRRQGPWGAPLPPLRKSTLKLSSSAHVVCNVFPMSVCDIHGYLVQGMSGAPCLDAASCAICTGTAHFRQAYFR